ncbi:Altered inheritance of mitochondria protein 6 [Xanthoria calcicola]
MTGDRNPGIDLNDGEDQSGPLKGVFVANATTSLILLVDVKTDSAATLPVIMKQLSPLRKRGLLTHIDSSRTIQGPITVVATGNTNFDTIYEAKDRFVFFDAPLDHQWREDNPTDAKLYNKDNSYYASVSLRKGNRENIVQGRSLG